MATRVHKPNRILNLTPRQFAFVLRACEQVNDMERDIGLDNIETIDLWPTDGAQPQVLTPEMAVKLRGEINELLDAEIVRNEVLNLLEAAQ